jgi:hypothetical protein
MNGLGPSKQITFRVPREIGEEIEAAAARDGRKLTPFVENLVEWAFVRYKEVGSILALRDGMSPSSACGFSETCANSATASSGTGPGTWPPWLATIRILVSTVLHESVERPSQDSPGSSYESDR